MTPEDYVEYIEQEDIEYIRQNFESLMAIALVVAESAEEEE